MVPGNESQVVIFLLFLLPGTVFQSVQTRLMGPSPEEQETYRRVLRALSYSSFFALAYLVIFGRRASDYVETLLGAGTSETPAVRQLALVAVVLLFVVPTVLATLDAWRPHGRSAAEVDLRSDSARLGLRLRPASSAVCPSTAGGRLVGRRLVRP